MKDICTRLVRFCIFAVQITVFDVKNMFKISIYICATPQLIWSTKNNSLQTYAQNI